MSFFRDNSGIFKDACDEQIMRALEMIGLKAEDYAKLKCPVDTGRLRNSITHTTSGKSGFDYTYSDNEGNAFVYGVGTPMTREKKVYIGTNVEYGAYVELGTSKQSPQPYLKPAITDHNNTYRRIVIEELRH